MHRIGPIVIVIVLLLSACPKSPQTAQIQPRPALADTLVSIFEQLKQAARTNQVDEFLDLLDTVEARQLKGKASLNGFRSLRTYVEHQFEHWPDPDTMSYVDLVTGRDYARLGLQGFAARLGPHRERVRWTFLLFRRDEDQWRLSAMSSMEKGRFDRYGTELTYLETELPPRLRFPRVF